MAICVLKWAGTLRRLNGIPELRQAARQATPGHAPAAAFTIVRKLLPRIAALALVVGAYRQAGAVNVLTNHNDLHNTGQNLRERILTPRNVRPGSLGKLFVTRLDGIDYGQPLLMTGVDITTGPHTGVQNVIFAATATDSVYAINADNGTVLWKTNLLTRFDNPRDVVTAREINPNWAAKNQPLEDTPVIDPATGALYVECA